MKREGIKYRIPSARQSLNTFLSEFLVEGIDLTTGSAKSDPHIAVRLDPDLLPDEGEFRYFPVQYKKIHFFSLSRYSLNQSDSSNLVELGGRIKIND